MNFRFLITVALAGAFVASSQAQVSSVLDGAYVKETNITKRVVPYPALREADVMYTKRVWRQMDLREKVNHQFYYPITEIQDRASLFDVVRKAVLEEGTLTAYGTGPVGTDDEFKYPLSAAQVDSLLNPTTTTMVDTDLDGEPDTPTETKNSITSPEILYFQVKEDWIWDRHRSERYVRIIGIAPMYEKSIGDGDESAKSVQPLFWLYYPECRYVFANSEAFNPFNDAQRRTFEDIFQKRYFASYIVKESNVYDRKISDYARGVDGLLEAERIKDDLFTLEHDLWHY
jgi:gliding motility associated protien GldN